MVRNVHGELVTDVSGQSIGAIIRSQLAGLNPENVILVSNQLDAQFFSIIYLFESSTRFEQLCAHLQEDNCINTNSGIISVEAIEWFKIIRRCTVRKI